MELLDYEKKHIDFLEMNSHECCLFLKRNKEFPLLEPCKLVLIGNGARNTVKGGTGSGDVASHFFRTIEDGLLSRKFEITSTKWMDEYQAFKNSTLKDYIKEGKKLARKAGYLACVYSMGYFEEEKNYSISCDFNGDACIYVLSRNSGEGNDRRDIKGDVRLTDKEIEDILYLNKKFKKFMLVLNVGGVIDLTPILEVDNILLLSQLGVVTGDILPKILLGEVNPSGKLTTTWAKPEDYPYFNEFGDLHDTYYKEGIYVGYRYFNTVGKSVLFPFGYGLSYTDFDIKIDDVSINKMIVSITATIKNIGMIRGKEVVQVYVTKPIGRLDQPKLELCGYQKTKELESGTSQQVTFAIDFTKLGSFDEETNEVILEKGMYILQVGNSSVNVMPVAKCILNYDIVLEKLESKCGDSNFIDLKLDYKKQEYNCKEYILDSSEVITKTVTYKKDIYIDHLMEKLSTNNLAHIVLGHHKSGFASIVGSSCEHAIGGAGETTLCIPEITKSLTMADGPAGLRLNVKYGKDSKGIYDLSIDPLLGKMLLFLPKVAELVVKPQRNRHGDVFYQYTTAIPIGTALAQSFNTELIHEIGKLIGEEMKIFNVDLWLAPALNIHRNILCGRNFEYYSEDPYISGTIASALIKGVESNSKLGTTIKHFACNNQEINRNNNNSHLSERTLRDIYLKGFEICIKNANPKALMTSYNLINGVHTSESYELVNDILRCEWGYQGLVMTDWIASGRSFCRKSIYHAPYASNNILAGNDLTMPGCPKDYKDILKAIKSGKLTRDDLLYSASRIYRSIIK